MHCPLSWLPGHLSCVFHVSFKRERAPAPRVSVSLLCNVCVCVCACVRACVRVCVRACVSLCVRACVYTFISGKAAHSPIVFQFAHDNLVVFVLLFASRFCCHSADDDEGEEVAVTDTGTYVDIQGVSRSENSTALSTDRLREQQKTPASGLVLPLYSACAVTERRWRLCTDTRQREGWRDG